MLGKTLPSEIFPLGVFFSVVAVGIDGQSAARQKLAPYLDVFGLHQLDQILHDDIHAVLMEIAVIAEAEQVELERLALHHQLIGDIGNINGRKIRLTRDRTERGELGAVEFDEIVVIGVLVRKGLEHLRSVVVGIFYVFIAEQRQALGFLFGSSCHVYTSVAGSSMPFARNAATLSRQVPHKPQGLSFPS